jgi:hypothetical protein
MQPTDDPPQGVTPQSKPSPFPVQRVLMIGVGVAGVTLVIVLSAFFGGLWLDRALGTGWILTILLVLLSAPLSLALTYWLAMRAIRDLNPPSQGAANPGGANPRKQIQDEEGGNDW